MYLVSTPASRGSGTASFDSLPKNLMMPPGAMPADRLSSDGVRLSGAASMSGWAGPIDLSVLDIADDDGLALAARNVFQILGGNPRLAESSFGKSAKLLVRATVELKKTSSLDRLPDDTRSQIARAAENARTFLAEHPRVANSPLGEAVAKMAKAVAAAVGMGAGSNQPRLADWLLEAMKRADAYLDEFPTVARLPLGEAVAKLIDGVKALKDGNPLDANLQTLAKRVGYFLQENPRLAQSEFGQLIAPLGRGLVAIDVSALPEAEPPAKGKNVSAAKTALVLDIIDMGEADSDFEVRTAA